MAFFRAQNGIIAMARAKRHCIPGQIWQLTHRCHKREFLLKLARDQRRWRQWRYESKRRSGLIILNDTVASNHIHLLGAANQGRNTIPDSLRLIAGRTGQEFNQRKNCKGIFGEDRDHATAIESGAHLLRCMVYIDLNMVRAGGVNHPSEWPFSGYNEIPKRRRKYVLINDQRLRKPAGFGSYQDLRINHRRWVEASLLTRRMV
jgi:putative transposase